MTTQLAATQEALIKEKIAQSAADRSLTKKKNCPSCYRASPSEL
jgi:hypothetical protein